MKPFKINETRPPLYGGRVLGGDTRIPGCRPLLSTSPFIKKILFLSRPFRECVPLMNFYSLQFPCQSSLSGEPVIHVRAHKSQCPYDPGVSAVKA